jgi:putative peptidoglycan lipid II flippase
MAVGVLVGGVTQIFFQLPRFLGLGYDFKIDMRFKEESFQRLLKQWVPILVSSSIFAINQQVAVFFASGLEDGSTSALSYALVFWQLPFGIFSASIMTVMFPRMSKQAAVADREGIVESLSYGLRFLLITLLPAALLYILMGKEIIAVALQRQKFTSQGTLMAFGVLKAYSFGLFSLGGFTLLQRLFYSLNDFRTPLIISTVVCVVDIGLSLWLKETNLRVAGLAAANSIAFTLGFILLLIISRYKLKRIGGRKCLRTLLRTIAAVTLMGLSLSVYLELTKTFWTEGSSFRNLFLLLIALLLSGGVVIGSYWVLGDEIVHDLLKRSRKRRKRT